MNSQNDANSEYNFPRNTTIPRTSGYEHSIITDDLDESEVMRIDYPIEEHIQKFLPNFKSRQELDPDQFYVQPKPPNEAIQIPDNVSTTIDKVVVQMLDLPALNSGKKLSHYIHSWCDISAVTNVEAKKIVTSFFTNKYMCISPQIKRVELQWEKTLNSFSFLKQTPSVCHAIRIFHYIGLGFSPEEDKIGIDDSSMVISSELNDLKQILSPSLLIFDCDKAAMLSSFLSSQNMKYSEKLRDKGNEQQTFFAFFACAKNEQLRIPSKLPQNFFSCILLSPAEAFSSITGIQVNNFQIFEQLLTIFTETIALDSLSTDVFYRLFRNNSAVASLWQRFLLAQRLMHKLGIHSQSFPAIKDMSDHQLWCQFEFTLTLMKSSNSETALSPIMNLSNMYSITFDTLSNPPPYVSAFIASLMQVHEIHLEILHKIAKFMAKSPQNCYTMGKVLNFKNLLGFNEISNISDESFTDWCCVLSGFLLVSPTLTRLCSSISTNDLMKISLNPNFSDQIRVFILSILVALRDSQVHLTYWFNNGPNPDKFVPLIFKSSPILREWIIIFCHSYARFSTDATIIGSLGIHAISMLLLYEKRKHTRAAALSVLTTLMAARLPAFNTTLIKCAIKAGIDGAHIVRHAFLLCAAIYMKLNKYIIDGREEHIDFDDLICNDVESYIKESNTINHSDEANYLKLKLISIVKFLQRDPYEENRNLANQIVFGLQNIDITTLNHDFCGYAHYIHRMAHTLLFTQKCDEYQIHQRYCDNFFLDDELQQFELIDTNSGSITSISFDFSHKTFCTGSSNGIISWGENRWKVCDDPICDICPLQDLAWAAISSQGVVYILRDELETPVDAFIPSALMPHGKSVLLSSPSQPIIFISQGNNEIIVWDIEALLAVHRIEVEAPPKLMTKINDKLYVALESGIVLQIDTNSFSIEKRNEMHKGQNIIRIGIHNNILFSAAENGPLYFWEDFEFPRQISDEWNSCTNFLVHPLYPIAIKTNDSVTLLQLYEDAPIELQTNRNHHCTCCCFDGDRPLCALGFDDSYVSVWRITKPHG